MRRCHATHNTPVLYKPLGFSMPQKLYTLLDLITK